MAVCVGDDARRLPERFQLEDAASAKDEPVSIWKAKDLETGSLCSCTVYDKAFLRDSDDLGALLKVLALPGLVRGKQLSPAVVGHQLTPRL